MNEDWTFDEWIMNCGFPYEGLYDAKKVLKENIDFKKHMQPFATKEYLLSHGISEDIIDSLYLIYEASEVYPGSIINVNVTSFEIPSNAKILLPIGPEDDPLGDPVLYTDPLTYGSVAGIATGSYIYKNYRHHNQKETPKEDNSPFVYEICNGGATGRVYTDYLIVPEMRCKECSSQMAAKVYANNKRKVNYVCFACNQNSLTLDLNGVCYWGCK